MAQSSRHRKHTLLPRKLQTTHSQALSSTLELLMVRPVPTLPCDMIEKTRSNSSKTSALVSFSRNNFEPSNQADRSKCLVHDHVYTIKFVVN